MDSRRELHDFAGKLLGQMLRGVDRAADMAIVMFGPDVTYTPRPLPPRDIPRFGLHIQCSWRISHGSSVIVGSADAYDPEAPPNSDTWAPVFARAAEVLADGTAIVRRVAASANGDLRVELSSGYRIEVFVDGSKRDAEMYRILVVDGGDAVVFGNEVEILPPPA